MANEGKVVILNPDGTEKEVREPTADEQKIFEGDKFKNALDDFRKERNFKLAQTDWTASSDLVMSNEMKEYRQKLRDATEGLDTVEKIIAYTFPTEVTK